MGTIEVRKFGITKKGENVKSYRLKNEFLDIEILSYGGILHKLKTKDLNGKFENIVLGFDTLEEYEEKYGFHFGAIVGRNAGRIKNGDLEILGKKYKLEINNGNNNLHGYPESYATKVWEAKVIKDEEKLKLILSRTSPHLEANFPGSIELTVTYTVDKNSLIIEYEGIPDRETYMNLTNHTYFNLSGDLKEDIGNQNIKLFSDEYIEVDEETLPTKISEVKNTVFDLREGRDFNEAFSSKENQIKIVNEGYDHPFVLSKKNEIDGKVIDKKSGRTLEFKTNQPVVVIYTGNYLKEAKKFIGNLPSKNHMGFCLETQDYPDVLKFLPSKSKIYSKENYYYQKTCFKFSNICK